MTSPNCAAICHPPCFSPHSFTHSDDFLEPDRARGDRDGYSVSGTDESTLHRPKCELLWQFYLFLYCKVFFSLPPLEPPVAMMAQNMELGREKDTAFADAPSKYA